MAKRRKGTGSVTKLGEGRYWARGPRQPNGKRAALGVWPTREEAWSKVDAELHASKVEQAPAPVKGTMRVIRELRPLSGGGFVEYLSFESDEAGEREFRARLDEHLHAWRRARDIRAYVKEIRQVFAERDYEPPEGGELDTWLEWCELQTCDDPIEEFRSAASARRRESEAREQPKRPRGRPRKS
jgi:DNA-binding transcriptional MerR regulator